MTDATKAVMPERGTTTRERILATAERLFAEYGVLAVSNRQISQAAGQVARHHDHGVTVLPTPRSSWDDAATGLVDAVVAC